MNPLPQNRDVGFREVTKYLLLVIATKGVALLHVSFQYNLPVSPLRLNAVHENIVRFRNNEDQETFKVTVYKWMSDIKHNHRNGQIFSLHG